MKRKPTEIDAGEAAIVTIDGRKGWALLLPNPELGEVDPKENVPVPVRLLAACMMRADDDEWVDEMLRWLDEAMDDELAEAWPAGNA
jgi:hypothetical protein